MGKRNRPPQGFHIMVATFWKVARMFELNDNSGEVRYIDFGRNGKVLFRLPVLGDDGVPMGIMSAFGIFWNKFQDSRDLTEAEVARAWSFFIDVLGATYPDATIQLAKLDREQFGHVITHWVSESSKIAGFDPKGR